LAGGTGVSGGTVALSVAGTQTPSRTISGTKGRSERTIDAAVAVVTSTGIRSVVLLALSMTGAVIGTRMNRSNRGAVVSSEADIAVAGPTNTCSMASAVVGACPTDNATTFTAESVIARARPDGGDVLRVFGGAVAVTRAVLEGSGAVIDLDVAGRSAPESRNT